LREGERGREGDRERGERERGERGERVHESTNMTEVWDRTSVMG
jgi:hypothetical protein